MKAQQSLFACLIAVAHTGAALHAQVAPVNAQSGSAPASVKQTPDQQVDAVFKSVDTPTSPGASVAVVANGKIVLAKG